MEEVHEQTGGKIYLACQLVESEVANQLEDEKDGDALEKQNDAKKKKFEEKLGKTACAPMEQYS